MLTIFSPEEDDIDPTKKQKALTSIYAVLSQQKTFAHTHQQLHYTIPQDILAILHDLLDADDFLKLQVSILSIRSRSSDCQTNLLLAFPDAPLQVSQLLCDACELIRIAVENSNANVNKTENLQLVESLLAFVRQLARKLKDVELPAGVVKLLIEIARTSPTPGIQIQAAGCLSAIAQHLNHFANNHILIAAVLIEKLRTSVASLIEESFMPANVPKTIDVLNVAFDFADALIDMYSEDDAIIMQSMDKIKLLDEFTRTYDRLQQSVNMLKRKSRREIEEALEDWLPVLENMKAFVVYKQKLLKS
jgi:hypothetical protein